jgi:gamma-glutamylcyclotransferase (GGCT)/AIG2-like uncharacterized protein YtfP
MYHFGYGSNLSLEYTTEMLPSATVAMKAYLPNFSLQFQVWSKIRKGGLSNVAFTPGKIVHGAIFNTTEEEMHILDEREGYYKGQYQRETFMVLGEDGKLYPADLYRAIDPQGPFTPSKSYVEIMLKGAKERGLDPEYIKTFQGFYDQAQ